MHNGMPLITSIHLSVLFIRELQTWEQVSVQAHGKELGANQSNEIVLWWSPKHVITPKQRITSLREGSPCALGASYSSEVKFKM